MKKISEYFLIFFNTKFLVFLFFYGLFVGFFLEVVILTSKIKIVHIIDNNIFNFIVSLREPTITYFMEFITFFGNPSVVLSLAFCIVLYLFFKKRYDFMFILLSSSLVASLVIVLIKNFFERERPSLENALLYAGGFSFPSGHAMISIAFYGVLAYFVFVSSKNIIEKLIAGTIGVLLVVLISFSRIYLGVHWPSDVFGSIILGIVWFGIIIHLSSIYRSINNADVAQLVERSTRNG